MTISITPSGRSSTQVGGDDISRAIGAAETLLALHGTTAEAAHAVYKAQWLEFDDEDPMTGLALIWIKARGAADIALTATWANPAAEVFCEMTA